MLIMFRGECNDVFFERDKIGMVPLEDGYEISIHGNKNRFGVWCGFCL